ncbi:MAG: 16S rRNA (guanine(527)-N(7))-methyltransferase RsmG [Alphaproteobacteria bacterium]|nr:16S rRNA (guanine(527)-N(7))-methyltransferase RsmG [Alphaproteobacteria bacterium]
MTAPDLTKTQIKDALQIDAEALARLSAYVDLLIKWQKRINLVAPKTLDEVWRRHILDSAQLLPLMAESPGPVLDLGSGAGFPGLVLAVLGRGDITLVESDRRKAAFLSEAARVTGAQVTVECCRIESLKPIRAGLITARALAPVSKLLEYAKSYSDDSTRYLFLKGERVEEELTDAQKHWKMNVTKVPSRSDSRGTIVLLEGVTHA